MPRPVVRLLVACGLLLAAAGLGRCTTESPVRKPGVATVEDDRARERRQQVRYTASWAVQITKGGDKMADLVARRHGYRNLGKVYNELVSSTQRIKPHNNFACCARGQSVTM